LKKGLLIAFIALVADQVNKYVMLYIVALPHFFVDNKAIAGSGGRTIEVTNFFNIVMVWNRGVSFGMFNHGEVAAYQPILLTIMALVIVAGLIYWLNKATNNWQIISIGLIIGGALGNVIDRAIYGAVADFYDFHLGERHWPAFNIADSCICVGVAILLIESSFGLGISKSGKNTYAKN